MMRLSSPIARMAIVVAVLTLVLFAMIGRKQWTLATGIPVQLETQPVDPRSLFRGDYVRLNYKISSFTVHQYPNLEGVKRGDPIYVSLKRKDEYWEPKAVSLFPPEWDGELILRGEVDRVGRQWNRETRSYDEVIQVWVRYGIENYFVPEGEGRAIERPKAGEKISIEVAVDSCGRGAIRAVLVNGKPRYTESLF